MDNLFGDISFGNVLPAGLSEEEVAADLSVAGALTGGVELGEVDLVYGPLATVLLEHLALSVIDLNLANGIENGLDAKLDAALNALDDVNANNDEAACNSMEAFINAVQAQSGNQIDEADADYLIDQATFIILVLCS